MSQLRNQSRFCAMKTQFCDNAYIALALLTLLLVGCGPDEHNPTANCINFGTSNVRRNIRLRLSLSVGRPPLENVNSETVQLQRMPDEISVSGIIDYAGERIMFTPDSPLMESTGYRFKIYEGIEDASGKPLSSIFFDFETGSLLQVYYVDLLRNYDENPAEIYSIAVYFSEGVDPEYLAWNDGNITVYDENYVAQFFDVMYYDEVALAVLNFSFPLTTDMTYVLKVGPYIYSSIDGGSIDGDRDGSDFDMTAFEMRFRYSENIAEGVGIADTVVIAQPYEEHPARCFLLEFD